MIPLFKVFVQDSAIQSIKETLDSGYIGQGPKVDLFEAMLRGHFKTRYLSTVNSCTSAIHLALHMCGEDEGDVISTPLTCTATNWPVLHNRMNIIWADLDPNTLNIDPEDVARKITPKTKAIIVVHWGGYPCDLDALKQIAEEAESKPVIIEDCAHCWNSYYKGRQIGTHGNYCCFSFQAIKHLTTGDGGLLITPNEKAWNRAMLLRWYGLDRTSSKDFRCQQDVAEPGFKFHMNDIAASLGIENMFSVDLNVKKHQDNAKFYRRALRDFPGVTLLEEQDGYESSYWIFTIKVDRRDDFKKVMAEKGIMTSQVHSPNHTNSCVSSPNITLPITTEVAKEMVAIPNGWWVTEEDRQYIVDCIKQGW